MEWSEVKIRVRKLEKEENDIFAELENGNIYRLDRYPKVLLELHSLQATILANWAGSSEVLVFDLLNMPFHKRNYVNIAASCSEY